jgi:hypothetical protein
MKRILVALVAACIILAPSPAKAQLQLDSGAGTFVFSSAIANSGTNRAFYLNATSALAGTTILLSASVQGVLKFQVNAAGTGWFVDNITAPGLIYDASNGFHTNNVGGYFMGSKFYCGALVTCVLGQPSGYTWTRLYLRGTVQAVAQWSFGGGWGTTPTITYTDAFDAAGYIIIQAKATTAANPTATLTFKDGTWTDIPSCSGNASDATTPANIGPVVVTAASATAVTFNWLATPTANDYVTLSWICVGH